MKLNEVVPWGRSLAEYKLMFALSEADLKKNILGCGDGPASFNTEMTAAGRHVVSFDPIYSFSKQEIQQRIEETYDTIISQANKNAHRYVWTAFQNADELGRARLSVMHTFLQDFEGGLTSGRYLPAALPSLPFQDKQFDLCLCSHLLFLYSEQLSLEFHLASIQELLRVASEVRIFPLLGLDCQVSPYLAPVQAHFAARDYTVEVRPVPYEFQRGGDHMMTLKRDSRGGASSSIGFGDTASHTFSQYDDEGSFVSSSSPGVVVSSGQKRKNPNGNREGDYSINGYVLTLRYDSGQVVRWPFSFCDPQGKALFFEGATLGLDEKK